MNNNLHNELRKEFQLDRLILFSDAVFAIAITLLVIEIKIPDVHKNVSGAQQDVSDKLLLQSLGHLIPKFIGFIISFMLIGIYWTVHHRMFGFVTNFNSKLLLLNLLFLFFVALMPFSTGFYSEYAGPELVREQLKVPMTFYVLNFCAVGFINYIMWIYIANPKNKLAEPPIHPVILKTAKIRSLIVPLVFLTMLTVAYLSNVMYAVWIPMFIPLVMKIMKKRITKAHKEYLQTTNTPV